MMLQRSKKKKSLHYAVQTCDLPLLKELLPYQQPDEKDKLGISAIQWAQWLNRQECLELLGIHNHYTLRLKDKETGNIQTLDTFQCQKQLHFMPSTQLVFPSAKHIFKMIKGLKRLHHLHWLEDQCHWQGVLYKDQLNKNLSEKIYIQHINKTVGFGVIAAQNFQPGDLIGEYTGEVRHLSMFSSLIDTTYTMEYPVPSWPGIRWVTNAGYFGDFTRFINHSHKPNAKIAVAYDGLLLRLLIVAQETINPNTEITYNYGSYYWKKRKQIFYTLQQ